MNQRVKLIGGQSVDLSFIGTMNVIKKNFNVLIIVLIVIVFNLIVYALYKATTRIEQPRIIIPTEVVEDGTGAKEIQPGRATVVSKPTAIVSSSANSGHEEINQGQTKPILGVNAGYEGETEYERVRNQIIKLGVSYEIAEHITRKCYDTAINPKHCVKSVVGISTSESSLFKRCKNNNCMGLKPSGELKGYDTLNLALDDRINRYNKYRYKNDSGKDWIIRSHYCKGDCSELSDGWSNWTRAFDSAVNKLGI